MKRLIYTGMFLLTVIGLYAQEPIENKKKELAALETEIKTLQAQAESVKKEIAALAPPVHWTRGGFTALNFNSVGLSDWAPGGVQSNAVTALGNLFVNYKDSKRNWINNLDMAYGIVMNEGDEDARKNEDKIDFLSKYGYMASGRLNYAVLANFKSQFAPGYDLSNLEDPILISKFLSPAFVNLSLGIDYEATPYLSTYFSPAAGKFTIVRDDSIAAQHLYIPATLDANGIQFYNENFRAEFGMSFNALFNKDFGKNVNVRSRLDLFNNYTDKNVKNRKNVDVNWETIINLKLTKYIGASLFTHLVYDNDVEVATAYDAQEKPIAYGPRLQFKRVLGVGFSYKF